MGMLTEGVWQSVDPPRTNDGGRLQRPDSKFRNWITKDGSPGPTGTGGFEAAPGRYHLYIARALSVGAPHHHLS